MEIGWIKKNGWTVLVGGLILGGCVIRILEARAIQFIPHSDVGVIGLMAKHMADGSDFPVFFYGQPYLGSLEPAVSALLFRFFGVSTFVLHLGTVLVGLLVMPLIYLWAREAAGRRSGIIALLLCVVGSGANLRYSVDPRCGYMTMMVCGLVSVYMAARISTLVRMGQRVSRWNYVGLGLATGLGWWSNQLVAAFLVTVLVILLAGFSWRMVRDGLLPALGMFFAGSAPWWLWNARHGWATFGFSESVGNISLSRGAVALSGSFLEALDLSELHNWRNDLCLAMLAGLAVLFLAMLVRDMVRRRQADTFYYRLAVPVLLVAIAMVSITSRYILFEGNVRYMLPAIPAIAVITAVGADWLINKWRIPFGWLVVALLVSEQLYLLPPIAKGVSPNRGEWQNAIRLADEVGPLCDNVCIGAYNLNWMNFASGERLCVASLPWERFAPYAKRAELAERPAFLGNYCDLRSFLAYTGARSIRKTVGGIDVDYALTPPPDDWRYLETSALKNAFDTNGLSCRDALTDLCMGTSWSVTLRRGETASLTFEFDRPRRICGIRFVSPVGLPPDNFGIQGRTNSAAAWEFVLPPTRAVGYFWSGPYVELEGMQVYLEARFHSSPGGLGTLRLEMRNDDVRPKTIRLDEILFMEKAAAPVAVLPSPEQCLAALRIKGVKQFFGPRWMLERIACKAPVGISMKAPSFVSRLISDLPMSDSSMPLEVVFSEITGLLMDERDAVHSRLVLQRFGRQWEEVTLGSHVLMVVSAATATNDWLGHAPVYWTEQGCFAGEISRFAKKRAELLYRQALAMKAAGDRAGMAEVLKKALSYYPRHQPARRALADVLETGAHEEASAQEAILALQTVPSVKAHVRFKGGVELQGITLPADAVTPGQDVDITCFWKCPSAVDAGSLAFFLHFVKGKERFQGDHVLLEDIPVNDIEYQPFPEIFTCTSRIKVPASVTVGEYRINVGLVNRKTGERLTTDTDLEQRRRAVSVPTTLSIRQ